MVLFNYSTRELTAKIVYYGPGICGKTTNLQFIHENLPGGVRGKMLSLATKTDRTLFFDFLPIDLGEIRGMKTRVQLYTVPGQVFYNETRKLVLKGVDGIVFVADSQETMLGANIESFKNLEENMKGHGMKLADMPHVIQFNKRDLPKLSSIEDMNASLNKYNAPFYESVATTGIGVQDTLKAIVKLVLLNLTKKYEPKSVGEVAPASAPSVAAPAMASVAAEPVAAARSAGAVAEFSTAAAAPEPQRRSIPPSPVEPPRKATPPAPEAISSFAEEEINGLVGEVEEIEPSRPARPTRPAEEGVWMGSRSEDAGGDRRYATESVAPSAHAESGPSESAASDVLLTEVASDDDLFSDPSLEIAKLAPGQSREILVPVILGEGASARRFKLGIRLRLDPIE